MPNPLELSSVQPSEAVYLRTVMGRIAHHLLKLDRAIPHGMPIRLDNREDLLNPLSNRPLVLMVALRADGTIAIWSHDAEPPPDVSLVI